MPKKKKGAKKKGAKKKGDVDPLGADSIQKRSEHELSLLKSKLSDRSEAARRAEYKAETLASTLLQRHEEKEDMHQDTLDITADLTRQYKTMQSQLMAKILELQNLTGSLRDQLDSTQTALLETKAEAGRTSREKDDMIAQLTQRIQSMESSYEAVLNEALDAMASKVETARDKWELESYVVQQRNKDVLMEFGLSHAAF